MWWRREVDSLEAAPQRMLKAPRRMGRQRTAPKPEELDLRSTGVRDKRANRESQG